MAGCPDPEPVSSDPMRSPVSGAPEAGTAIGSPTPDSLNIRWSPAVDGEDTADDLEYKVILNNASGNVVVETAYISGENSKTISGLAPATDYQVIVVVKDTDGNETEYPLVDITTTSDAHPDPDGGGLTGTIGNSDEMTVEWPVSVVSGGGSIDYELFRSTNPQMDTIAEIEANGESIGAVTDGTSINLDTSGWSSGIYYLNLIATSGGKKTAYVKWVLTVGETVTVTYDANTADTGSAPGPQLGKIDRFTVLGDNGIGKTGCAFTGWNSAADGSGTNYQPGDTITANSDTVLYARWIDNSLILNVTYNLNGGSGTAPTDSNDYISGDSATVLSDGGPTRSGYRLLGWNTESDGSGAAYITGDVFTITANTVLYAEWRLLLKEISGFQSVATQAQLDALVATFDNADEVRFLDELEIKGSVTDLSGLINVTEVGKSLYIDETTALISLAGLDNLKTVGDGAAFTQFSIYDNAALTSVDGLGSLQTIDTHFFSVIENDSLLTLGGLSSLETVNATMNINNNPELATLQGMSLTTLGGGINITGNVKLAELSDQLNALVTINGNLTISDTKLTNMAPLDALVTINGNLTLSNNDEWTGGSAPGRFTLTTVGGSLTISGNVKLVSLIGLESLTFVGTKLVIENNAVLTTLNGLSGINDFGSLNGNLTGSPDISLNGTPKGGDLTIKNNPALNTMSAISGITRIRTLTIENNDGNGFETLAGLENVDAITDGLFITGNDYLRGVAPLDRVDAVNASFAVAQKNIHYNIEGNGIGYGRSADELQPTYQDMPCVPIDENAWNDDGRFAANTPWN